MFWLSRVTFCYVSSFLLLGSKRKIEPSDIRPLSADNKPERNFRRLEVKLAAQRERGAKPDIIRALFSAHALDFALLGLLQLVVSACNAAQPILTFLVTSFLEQALTGALVGGRGEWIGQALGSLLGLFGTSMLSAFAQANFTYGIQRIGTRVYNGVSLAVFRKGLRLTAAARAKFAVGGMVNMLQVDAKRLGMTIGSPHGGLHDIWSAPVDLIVSIVQLNVFVGPAATFSAVRPPPGHRATSPPTRPTPADETPRPPERSSACSSSSSSSPASSLSSSRSSRPPSSSGATSAPRTRWRCSAACVSSS